MPPAPYILLVEDEPDAREELLHLLEEHRYEVRSAGNGREALYALISTDDLPCLILLDLHMPVMGGWEFLAILRSYNRLSKIPVVLVTSKDLADEAKAQPPTFEGFVRKPFRPPELLETVKRVCESGRTQS